MVTRRRGASTLGCLVMLLLVAAGVYFGVNVGEVYWRYYEYQDDIAQQVRFAGHNTDEQIARRLAAAADSLGLPDPAGRVMIRRVGQQIAIAAEYYERVEVPLYVRELHFRPHAEGTF